MSFNIGLSGLFAANKQLDVTGNNISNVATKGFKFSRAEFADVYSATKLGSGARVVGNGVRLANVSQQFTNGDINNTGNVLDVGIQGQGFFVLNSNGSLTYTRAGNFRTDKEGYITNSDGTARLQGYGVDANGKIINGVLTDLRIDTSNLAPKPTDSISSTINLDSNAKVIDTAAKSPAYVFNPSDNTTYTKQFSTPIYDTQGNKHVMDQYMIKTGPNTWQTYTLVNGRNPDGTAFSMNNQAPITMKFDASGKLQSLTPPTPASASQFTVEGNKIVMAADAWTPGTVTKGVFTPNGAKAAPKGVNIDMTRTGSVSGETNRSVIAQNGYSTGQIASLTIDGNGVLMASFSNEQTRAIGQISLASFTNEQGLQPVGGTQWRETFASGIPGYDAPKTGTLGAVVSGALEESNVNLTNELVNLIKAQSNYQASAKIISTQNSIMQTTMQMT
ncbi:flagellar hook protein FlgE [Pseudomonas sp. CMR5c]|uniref:flagellar hook protein FlgE n=1 Tax=Pseudomonas sp. CMR5c TaxID=658630 RepID=UPI00069ECB69|nr:flagellar hook protein FlgE [Pseudomonas sp. CMR5c]ALG76241.1 flagellar hook protein FlgE [Pseudomonas sp. CMR5c]AZC17627.1 Flagellar hook protein FlgE [Pseudomonas sp. CMR5c]